MKQSKYFIKTSICVIVLGWRISFGGVPAAAQGDSLSLGQCIGIALDENLVIKSTDHLIQASRARIYQAKAFTQPSLNFDSDLQPGFFDFRNSGESYIGVSKSILFPGKRKIRTEIAKKSFSGSVTESEIVKLNIIYEVKLAYYTLLLNQKQLEYANENKKLAEDFLNKTRVKYKSGDAAQVEVLRAQVEVAKATGEIEPVMKAKKEAEGYMNFLLGREINKDINVIGELIVDPFLFNLDDLKNKAFEKRPELTRVRLMIEEEKLKTRQAKMKYLPDLDIGAARHNFIGEGKTWDVTLGMPIPLFVSQISKGEVAESKANNSYLQNQLLNLKNSISLEVENAYRNAVMALDMINLYRSDMLNQSESVYEKLSFSYQEGEIGGIDLIEARKTLIQNRRSYIDAIFNYAAALTLIEKSVGESIEP